MGTEQTPGQVFRQGCGHLITTSDTSLVLSLQLSAALESCVPGALLRGLPCTYLAALLQWQRKDACSVTGLPLLCLLLPV